MEPDDIHFVQLVLDDGELSPPFAVCTCCDRPVHEGAVVEFKEDVTVRVQEWDSAGEVEKGLRELGFS
jgi:hypothetical protein